MRNLVVRFDWAIKRLLRNKANFVVLEGFLSTLLGRKIKIDRILESEGNQEKYDDKFNRVDLLAEDESGELMIFEVNNYREVQLYDELHCKGKVREKNAWPNVRQVFSVNILHFSLGVGRDHTFCGQTEFRGVNNPNERLFLVPEIKGLFLRDDGIVSYILRPKNFDGVVSTPLDEWMSYLKTCEIEERFSAAGLGEARTLLNYNAMDAKSRADHDAYVELVRYQHSVISSNYELGKLDAYEEEYAKGFDEGRTEAHRNFVQRLKNKGMAAEQVADLLCYPIDEVLQYWDCQP